MKEYHVWDAVYRTDGADASVLEGRDTSEREALRAALIADPQRYFRHFAALLDQPATRLTADITPAYSALPADAFDRIREGFGRAGVAVKVVFLIRDPVERCWSAVRMYRRKQATIAGLNPELGETEYLLRYATTGHAQRRGRYDRTIATLERVFGPESVFVGIYERLFDRAVLQSLSDFLCVAPRAEAADDFYNVSPKAADLPSAVRCEVAGAYADTLGFCRDRFPQTLDLWRSYLDCGPR